MINRFVFLFVAFMLTLFFPTHSVYASHDDFVVLANGSSGPGLQIFGLDGTLRQTSLVLGSTFTNLSIDPDVRVGSGSGHERILVCGNSPTGASIELRERDFSEPTVLSIPIPLDFTGVRCLGDDITGDGVDEIVVFAQETGGAATGFIVGAFDQNTGTLIFGNFVLDPTFTSEFFFCTGDECEQ